MTSRERLLKTIQGKTTDRIPVSLFIQDHGHYIHQLYPEINPFDYEKIAYKIIDYQKDLGCDVFVRMVFDLFHPFNIIAGGVNDGMQAENWKVETEYVEEGDNLIKKSTITTPDGVLMQDFVRTRQNKGTYVYCCTKKPILSQADLEIAMKHEPMPDDKYAKMVAGKISRVKDYLGNDGILGTWVSGGPFNNASRVFSHDELYMLFYTDSVFFDLLMQYATKRSLAYAKIMIDANTDVAIVGGNVPGGFLGKDVYEQFILPYEKAYIDAIHEMGKPTLYHNCGEIMNLVESYKKLGCTVVEPFSPVPLGDTDLEKAVDLVKGDYGMIAGVDQINVIKNGTVEHVEQATRQLMETGKKNKGKFIAQNADFLEMNTPTENVEAFVRTALKNATY